MRRECFVAAGTAVLAFLFSMQGEAQTSSQTGIEGVVTVSPARPGPTKEGIPNSAPLANATFTVENEKGTVASFTTDDQGRFRVSLDPGHYTVRLNQRRIGHSGPFEADVSAGKMTTVQWQCDSGMR